MNSKSSSTKSYKYYFYDELFIQFDSLINKVKNNLSKNNEFISIYQERSRLVGCKKDLNSALQILLSIDNFKDSISEGRKKDLIERCRLRYNDFEQVKELVDSYHKKLRYYYDEDNQNEDDYTHSDENKLYKSRLLKVESKDDEDNDLTEHLLLEETKRALEQATKNLSDTSSKIKRNYQDLQVISNHLEEGDDRLKQSNKRLRTLSNKSFFIKLLLHLVVVFLFISIIILIVMKYLHNNRNKKHET
jgi:hypothetical protein